MKNYKFISKWLPYVHLTLVLAFMRIKLYLRLFTKDHQMQQGDS